MSKIISYALFGAGQATEDNFFEFAAYLRGLVWNVKFNKLLYPDWVTHIEVDSYTYSKYDNILRGLYECYGASLNVNEYAPLCKAMLWRLKKVFDPAVEYLICRDADALTSYREAQAVGQFVSSGYDYHWILDNPAHAGAMGGMTGFRCSVLRQRFKHWQDIIDTGDTWERGKDQVVLNKLFNTPECKARTIIHESYFPSTPLPNVDPKLWETNLCTRHIGSAGAVDLEVLRQLKRFDKEIPEFEAICQRYPNIFYWYAK